MARVAVNTAAAVHAILARRVELIILRVHHVLKGRNVAASVSTGGGV